MVYAGFLPIYVLTDNNFNCYSVNWDLALTLTYLYIKSSVMRALESSSNSIHFKLQITDSFLFVILKSKFGTRYFHTKNLWSIPITQLVYWPNRILKSMTKLFKTNHLSVVILHRSSNSISGNIGLRTIRKTYSRFYLTSIKMFDIISKLE